MIEILKATARAGAVAGMAAVFGLAGMAGTALADGWASAPYAQVAAEVRGDGTIAARKGVSGVTRVGNGQYCVAVSNNDLNLTATIPFATLADEVGFAVILRPSAANCGGGLRSYYVETFDENGVRGDARFRVLVP